MQLDDLLVPNFAVDESMNKEAYCRGRSLLKTIPEPQNIDVGTSSAIYVLCD